MISERYNMDALKRTNQMYEEASQICSRVEALNVKSRIGTCNKNKMD